MNHLFTISGGQLLPQLFAKGMKDLGYNQNYHWEAGFQHDAGFLPAELQGVDFFS